MDADSRTWMVLIRDVSDLIRTAEGPTTVITLVLHTDTGLILGSSVATSAAEATKKALSTAITKAPAPLVPGAPDRVLCKAPDVDVVNEQLGQLIEGATPPAEEIIPGQDAEDIFNELLMHLIGGRASAN